MSMPNIGSNTLIGALQPFTGDSGTLLALQSASNKYQVSFEVMYDLAFCESRLQQSAIGDSGKAVGIYQWWASSWEYYNGKYETDLDRNNISHQAELTARVLKDGGKNNWYNCFQKPILADKI